MVNILLVTHGEFAQGITSALTLIMGEAKGYATVSLNIGQSPDAFLDERLDALRTHLASVIQL